ncbi:iron (metal) dependent repressor, dtxr family protein [Flammeovirgaceae bacterium 311]|nr:iron (metal) dependent repressor, dtxr family protein [Flammeovirgaceae bacterium 311]
MLSLSEENYLKAVFHLSNNGSTTVQTNALADAMQTKPASATDMIRKLAAKELVDYEKYRGLQITDLGRRQALKIVRRHRLWEVFLVQKLGFMWDEVHDIADQLEHVQSSLLTDRLDQYLGFPKYDPHGDPIPDAAGEFVIKPKILLTELPVQQPATVVAVKDSSTGFLQYLDRIGAYIGATVAVEERMAFDGSLHLKIDGTKAAFLSREAAENIMVTA